MAADRVVLGPGFRLTLARGSVTEKTKFAIIRGLKESGRLYRDAVLKNISLDDHTLEELRRLGYPYAVKSDVPKIHKDDRMVHEQTGHLKASIKLTDVQTQGREFTLYVISDAEYAAFLIHGTSKMRPRKFHEKAAEDLGDKMFQPLVRAIREVKHEIRVVGMKR